MVLLALPPADHLLIERDRGQFVPSRRRRMMANARAERLLKIRTQPRAAYPRRCSSNANSLGGQNSARFLEICVTFQRDILRRHLGVRVLHTQPASSVSTSWYANPAKTAQHRGISHIWLSPTLAELLTRRALVTFLTWWTNRADQKPRSIVSLVDLVSAGLASAHPSAWSPMAR